MGKPIFKGFDCAGCGEHVLFDQSEPFIGQMRAHLLACHGTEPKVRAALERIAERGC